ncbi:MAG: hypothetical protein ACHP8A_11910 [Terriglobales bacterium]
MRLAISVWILCIAAIATAQDVKHAPTLESCVADTNLWSSQIPGFPFPTPDQLQGGTKSLTVRELKGRGNYLVDCISAYPQQLYDARKGTMPTAQLSMDYDSITGLRYAHFIVRHHLWDEFESEDQAGER